tara:strand:+ start:340 stop:627 length:288 start_codon:yes stop_codon:yes gene_type:complete
MLIHGIPFSGTGTFWWDESGDMQNARSSIGSNIGVSMDVVGTGKRLSSGDGYEIWELSFPYGASDITLKRYDDNTVEFVSATTDLTDLELTLIED